MPIEKILPHTVIKVKSVTKKFMNYAEIILKGNPLLRTPKSDCLVSAPKEIINVVKEENALTIKKAVSDKDLRKIHEINLEAFGSKDYSFGLFHALKESSERLNFYTVKNKSNEIIGSYELFPVENDSLYVAGLAIPKKIRKTALSYQALKLIQKNIRDFVLENNVKKVCLHVDSKNKRLFKVYKELGFEVKNVEFGYYANSNNAYYMEADVQKILNTPEGTVIKQKFPSIKKMEDLEEKLKNIKNENGESKFNLSCRNIIKSSVQTSEQAKFKLNLTKKLSEIKELKADDIADIVFEANTIEQAKFKLLFVRKMAKGESFNSEYIKHLANIAETAQNFDFKLDLASNLSNAAPWLLPNEITKIVQEAKTPERAATVLKTATDKEFIKNLSSLKDSHFAYCLYAYRLITDTDIDINKMNKVYNFLNKKKRNVQEFGSENFDKVMMRKLFSNSAMISFVDLLDYETIKYSTSLKYSKFKDLMFEVSSLKNKLDTESYNNLKNNLSKITTPEQKLTRINNVSDLIKVRFTQKTIDKFISLIEDEKAVSDFFKEKIYQELNIETNPEVIKKLCLDEKNLSGLLVNLLDFDFALKIKDLIKLIKENPSKSLSELRKTFEQDKMTKKLFEHCGIN